MGCDEGIGCYRFISVIGQVGILVPCSRSPIGLACSVLSQIRHPVLNAFAAPRGYAFKPVLTFAVAVGVSSDPITSG
ncbi:hypothetical protein [Escherichia coli]|uniref:hypothetical protein n=1 Tax=Escherichia coli TaxID=562 RepID=UPI003F886412